MLAFYGHGSYFADIDDPADIDVMVVTADELTVPDAAAAVVPLLDPHDVHRLDLDVHIAHPDQLTAIERAILSDAVHLAGPEIDVEPPTALEWAWAMGQTIFEDLRKDLPGEAALDAVSAVLAADGRVVTSKSAAVAATQDTPWGDLARAAWAGRDDPTFDHPDLRAVLLRAGWSCAGEADSDLYECRGWSSRENQAAIFTIYRQALTSTETREALAVPAGVVQQDGRLKSLLEVQAVVERLQLAAVAANDVWRWAPSIDSFEAAEVHTYRPGDSFGGHVDRLPMYPTRLLNVVAMLEPAEEGGQLWLDLGGVLIEPDLEVGDIVVFTSTALHGVTTVEAGCRRVAVTHARDRRPGA